MRRFALLVVAFLLVAAAPAGAQQGTWVTVRELQRDGATIEGQITVVGELIGDYGFRSDGSMWTQLNGDGYAYEPILDGGKLEGGNVGVAVRIPEAIARTLDKPGGYRVRGPLVRVVGQWKYHDPKRGGESYVEVTQLDVLQPGRELVEHPDYWVMAAGLIMIAAAVFMRRRELFRRR